MILQPSGADLGALQVLKDANRSLLPSGGAAQPLYIAGVLLVRSVGKIQPGDVHPQAHKLAQHRFRVRGRANGADDLGPACGSE
jgi:hypothetical protein